MEMKEANESFLKECGHLVTYDHETLDLPALPDLGLPTGVQASMSLVWVKLVCWKLLLPLVSNAMVKSVGILHCFQLHPVQKSTM